MFVICLYGGILLINTHQVPLVEKELLTFLGHLNSPLWYLQTILTNGQGHSDVYLVLDTPLSSHKAVNYLMQRRTTNLSNEKNQIIVKYIILLHKKMIT
jgi:hypothetical protein